MPHPGSDSTYPPVQISGATSHNISELSSEPVRIWFHIAAEMATAFVLIVSGIALLFRTAHASELFFIALGMLFYTSLVSPGYFAQKGQWRWLLLFAALIGLGAVSAYLIA